MILFSIYFQASLEQTWWSKTVRSFSSHQDLHTHTSLFICLISSRSARVYFTVRLLLNTAYKLVPFDKLVRVTAANEQLTKSSYGASRSQIHTFWIFEEVRKFLWLINPGLISNFNQQVTNPVCCLTMQHKL